MKQEEFERRIHALLPEASSPALESWISSVQTFQESGVEAEEDHYDLIYVELAMVRRHYGLEMATTLFNYCDTFQFNYFELRDAARLLLEGRSLEEIGVCADEYGCEPTAEELAESKAALHAFRAGQWDPAPAPPWQQTM